MDYQNNSNSNDSNNIIMVSQSETATLASSSTTKTSTLTDASKSSNNNNKNRQQLLRILQLNESLTLLTEKNEKLHSQLEQLRSLVSVLLHFKYMLLYVRRHFPVELEHKLRQIAPPFFTDLEQCFYDFNQLTESSILTEFIHKKEAIYLLNSTPSIGGSSGGGGNNGDNNGGYCSVKQAATLFANAGSLDTLNAQLSALVRQQQKHISKKLHSLNSSNAFDGGGSGGGPGGTGNNCDNDDTGSNGGGGGTSNYRGSKRTRKMDHTEEDPLFGLGLLSFAALSRDLAESHVRNLRQVDNNNDTNESINDITGTTTTAAAATTSIVATSKNTNSNQTMYHQVVSQQQQQTDTSSQSLAQVLPPPSLLPMYSTQQQQQVNIEQANSEYYPFKQTDTVSFDDDDTTNMTTTTTALMNEANIVDEHYHYSQQNQHQQVHTSVDTVRYTQIQQQSSSSSSQHSKPYQSEMIDMINNVQVQLSDYHHQCKPSLTSFASTATTAAATSSSSLSSEMTMVDKQNIANTLKPTKDEGEGHHHGVVVDDDGGNAADDDNDEDDDAEEEEEEMEEGEEEENDEDIVDDDEDDDRCKEHADTDAMVQMEYWCSFDACRYKANSLTKVKSHEVQRHVKKIVKCSQEGCAQVFDSASEFNSHLNVAHIAITYRCPVNDCKEQFDNTNRLRKHQRSNHKRSTIDCTACGKKYKNRKSLGNHLLNEHPDEPISDEYLTQTVETEMHLPELAQCTINGCDLTFAKKANLKKHIKESHTEEYLTCKYCDKMCKNRNNLTNHIWIMHEEGEYSCTVDGCDFIGKYRKNLLNHKKLRHQRHRQCPIDECKEMIPITRYQRHLSSLHKIKNYGCSWPDCGKAFADHNALKNHVRIHLNFKRYKCKWPNCGYKSEQRFTVITHIRVCHFKLPRTKKKQMELNIEYEPGKTPYDFLEVCREDICI